MIRACAEMGADAQWMGMGGPAMQEAGMALDFSMDQVNTVGITEVITKLPSLLNTIRKCRRMIKQRRPDAVVLIDAPDFNFFLASTAIKMGIPVYYYISPQVWAWRSGRVKFLRRNVKRILCILPFEKPYYESRGVAVDYVGHPLLDQMDLAALDRLEPEPLRVGLLPGSRRKEVATLLPQFARAAVALKRDVPGVRFSLMRAPGMDVERLRGLWAEAAETPMDDMVDMVEPEERYQGMRRCVMLMAASGTAVLEAALMGVPAMVTYKLSPLTYWLAEKLVKVNCVSLPNLILGREVLPEMVQEVADAESLIPMARAWLTHERILPELRRELARLRRVMGEPGAPGRVASIILSELSVQSGG